VPLTLVIVDDDSEFRLIVRALLEPLADLVTVLGEAADGAEALALVQRERPDLVITDLVMPRLDGVELTRWISAELPRTRVILMSSHVEDAYRLRASASGAAAFISKHVISSGLVPAVRDVIRRRLAGGSDRPPVGPDPSASCSAPT
jgi:DNA-binding NarL/FixJ family response regulator